MNKFENHPVFQQLVYSREAISLGTWAKSRIGGHNDYDPRELLIDLIIEEKSRELEKSFLRADYIANRHSYHELTLSNPIEQKMFAIAMAQTSLMDSLGALGIKRGITSILSYLFYTEGQVNYYDIKDFDKVYSLVKKQRNESAIEFKDRFKFFPDLLLAEELGNTIRQGLFWFLLRTDEFIVLRNDTEEYRQNSLDKLSELNLLDFDPTPIQILSFFKADEIRRFAGEIGIKHPGKTKSAMVSKIANECSTETIQQKINMWKNDPLNPWRKNIKLARITIRNRPLLKLFLREQYEKLESYLICLTPDHPKKTQQARVRTHLSESNPPLKSFDRFSRADPFGYFSGDLLPKNQEILDNYWDNQCEEIMNNAIDENLSINIGGEVFIAVVKYFQKSELFESLQKTIFFPDDFRIAHEDDWRQNLHRYISRKLANKFCLLLNSDEIICPGCGEKFLKWSIPVQYALRVKMNIQFCPNCYSYILNHSIYADTYEKDQLKDEELLLLLSEFANSYVTLPIKYLTKENPDLQFPSYPTEEQITVGKMLLKMPARAIFSDRFGSFKNALDKLGLIPEIIYTARGARCIAEDGHECLSLSEKIIDDWLSARKIPHEIEVHYPYHYEYNKNNSKRTDWKVSDTYIEFAGLLQDPEYSERMEEKIKLCRSLSLALVVIEPNDLNYLEKKLGFLQE